MNEDRQHFELEHREAQLALGAYVLGVLDEREALRLERHLSECGHCAGDVEDLRPAVDVLAQSVPRQAPDPALRERVMRAVRAEHAERTEPVRPRRAWFVARPALAGALATAVLAVGVGGGIGIWSATHGATGAPPARSIVASVAPRAGAHAHARLELRGARSVLHVKGMDQPAPGHVYQVWLQRGNDPPKPTDALFTPRANGRASVVVPGDVRHAHQVMVTQELQGGASVPTLPVLIDVSLS